MELGCFMAGVVLSSNGEDLVHKVNIKDKLFLTVNCIRGG